MSKVLNLIGCLLILALVVFLIFHLTLQPKLHTKKATPVAPTTTKTVVPPITTIELTPLEKKTMDTIVVEMLRQDEIKKENAHLPMWMIEKKGKAAQ